MTWDDGATAEPSYDQLQGYCPCAGCRGHGAGEIVFQKPKRAISAIELAPVGTYAIAIAFAGGCSSGIFSFGFLRDICRRENLLVENP